MGQSTEMPAYRVREHNTTQAKPKDENKKTRKIYEKKQYTKDARRP